MSNKLEVKWQVSTSKDAKYWLITIWDWVVSQFYLGLEGINQLTQNPLWMQFLFFSVIDIYIIESRLFTGNLIFKNT